MTSTHPKEEELFDEIKTCGQFCDCAIRYKDFIRTHYIPKSEVLRVIDKEQRNTDNRSVVYTLHYIKKELHI